MLLSFLCIASVGVLCLWFAVGRYLVGDLAVIADIIAVLLVAAFTLVWGILDWKSTNRGRITYSLRMLGMIVAIIAATCYVGTHPYYVGIWGAPFRITVTVYDDGTGEPVPLSQVTISDSAGISPCHKHTDSFGSAECSIVLERRIAYSWVTSNTTTERALLHVTAPGYAACERSVDIDDYKENDVSITRDRDAVSIKVSLKHR